MHLFLWLIFCMCIAEWLLQVPRVDAPLLVASESSDIVLRKNVYN